MRNKHTLWLCAVAVAALALPFNAFAQTLQEGEIINPDGSVSKTTITTFTIPKEELLMSFEKVEAPPMQPPPRAAVEILATEGAPTLVMREGTGDGSTVMITRSADSDSESMTISTGDDTFVWNPRFGEELGLTQEQRMNIQYIVEGIRTQRAQGGGNAANPGSIQQRLSDARTRMSQALTPEQQTRLREISFQATGGLNSPFLNERMLEFADLTAEQKEKIRSVASERNAATVATIREGGSRELLNQLRTPEGRAQLAAESEARNKKYSEQIVAVLTPEQKAKAEKLTAEAPALRERLGMQTQQAQGQPRQRTPAQLYTPGDDSWKPGDDVPDTPNPNPRNRRGGGVFPRGE